MGDLKHFKFKVPVTGYMTLYMHGLNSYDAIERLKNNEGGVGWSEIWDVEKQIDSAEIIDESSEPPQFLFTDIKNIRVQIVSEEIRRERKGRRGAF